MAQILQVKLVMKVLEIFGITLGILYELSAFLFRSFLRFIHHLFYKIYSSPNKSTLGFGKGSASGK